jgi:hypothetical protein
MKEPVSTLEQIEQIVKQIEAESNEQTCGCQVIDLPSKYPGAPPKYTISVSGPPPDPGCRDCKNSTSGNCMKHGSIGASTERKWEPLTQPGFNILTGWKCPGCGVCLAPFVSVCPFCPHPIYQPYLPYYTY